MLWIHEVHRTWGEHEDEFEALYRDEWMPALAQQGDAKLLYFAHLTHGSGRAYTVITVTAARDTAAYGTVAAGGAIAVGVGPLIGGLFTTYWSWRYVFVGEVLIIGVVLLLNRRTADTPKEEGARLDLVGTALSALGLGLIVYGVLRAGSWGFVRPKPDAPTWLGLSPTVPA